MGTLAGSLKSSKNGLNEPIINFRDTNPATHLSNIHNLKSLMTSPESIFQEQLSSMIGVGWQRSEKLRMKQQFPADIWPFKLLP